MKKILLHEIALRPGYEQELRAAVAARLGVDTREISGMRIVRKSLDARKKQNIVFKYSVEVSVEEALAVVLIRRGFGEVKERHFPALILGKTRLRGHIVVVGAGPCGLFASYLLSQMGYRPILIERGKPIGEREKDFERLRKEAVLDPESNACFGEGGAGAFSDGKLTTRIKDPRAEQVLSIFVRHGAPRETAYLAKPHLGTDRIRRIVAALREEIRARGGEVVYGAKLTDIKQRAGKLTAVTYTKRGTVYTVDTNACILAIGHSARDTFPMLLEKGVEFQKKPFAIGVRVEHARGLIDAHQYGKYAAVLGAAEYVLRARAEERGVYSFCMCPGGEVICSATEKGHTAVNGMSRFRRDGAYSNSALVVSVGVEDMPAGPLGGIVLQRAIEAAAYDAAGGYGAPAQTYPDFLDGHISKNIPSNSYLPYAVAGDLAGCLPGFIRKGIVQAAKEFDAAIPGFVREGLLIGTETRTSSPVRMYRGEDLCSHIAGLYPAGEGAGYAGGIMSAAVDGLKVAETIIRTYAPPAN